MKMKAVAADNLAKREDVYEEEEGAKYRTLGDSTSDRGHGGFVWTQTDKLLSMGEV